jgi:hypothetical protein
MKLSHGLMALVFVGACLRSPAETVSGSNELQEGRYVLVMMTGRLVHNTRVPGIILDSYRGIVWTCQNLQDEKPLWVKTDLGQNGNKEMTKKKYICRMMEWQDADLRMPAVVVDVDDGKVWNCPNIVDGKSSWIQKNLQEDGTK